MIFARILHDKVDGKEYPFLMENSRDLKRVIFDNLKTEGGFFLHAGAEHDENRGVVYLYKKVYYVGFRENFLCPISKIEELISEGFTFVSYEDQPLEVADRFWRSRELDFSLYHYAIELRILCGTFSI
jgi:hypothetical protein